ncbi:hypothetical protein ACLOJK_012065 [Asimina triloba]
MHWRWPVLGSSSGVAAHVEQRFQPSENMTALARHRLHGGLVERATKFWVPRIEFEKGRPHGHRSFLKLRSSQVIKKKTASTDSALEMFKQQWELFRVACDHAEEFFESV